MVMEFLEGGDLLEYLFLMQNKVRCVIDHACVLHTYIGTYLPAYIYMYIQSHTYIHMYLNTYIYV